MKEVIDRVQIITIMYVGKKERKTVENTLMSGFGAARQEVFTKNVPKKVELNFGLSLVQYQDLFVEVDDSGKPISRTGEPLKVDSTPKKGKESSASKGQKSSKSNKSEDSLSDVKDLKSKLGESINI